MSVRVRGFLLGAVFAALLAIAIVSFVSLRLWDQRIWNDIGQSRLLALATAAVALAALLYPLRSPLLGAALIAAAFCYTAANVGPGAAFGIVYWLCGSWCLGRLTLRLLRLQAGGGSMPAPLVELPVGFAVLAFVMNATVWLPIHHRWVHLLWPAVCLAIEARNLPAGLKRLRQVAWRQRLSTAAYLVAVLVAFLIFAQWQAAMMPEVSADGLAMHLTAIAWVSAHASFHFDVTRATWAVMPMAGDWLPASAYLVGGEAAAKLANFAFLMTLACLVYSIVRRWVGSAGALLAMALFLSSPMAYLVTGSMFVENAWTLFLLAAIAALERWRETGDRRWVVVAAALAGSAVAGKFGALVCLVALLLGVALALWGEKRMRGAFVLAGLVFLLFASPPYVQSFVRTGNPMFPYLNTYFRSPLYDTTAPFRDARWSSYLRPDLLYQMTFRSHLFMEMLDGGAGFHLFVLWPVALLALRRKLPFWAIVAAAGAPLTLLMVFSSVAYLRYVYPMYVLVAILAGWLFAEARRYGRWLLYALAGGAVVCALGNTWFLGSSGWYNKDFVLNSVVDPGERQRFLDASAPQRQLIQYLNEYAPGQPAAFLEDSVTAGFLGYAYTSSWHTTDFALMLQRAQSAAQLKEEFARRNVRYAVAAMDGDRYRSNNPEVQTLLGQCGEKVRQAGPLILLRIRPGCPPAASGN